MMFLFFNKPKMVLLILKDSPVKIEKEILFPLMQKSLFVDENIGRVKAKKWIMVPYNRKSGNVCFRGMIFQNFLILKSI